MTVATDTTNSDGGIAVVGFAVLGFDPAVVDPPPTLVRGTRVDAAIPLPVPTLTNGRPT